MFVDELTITARAGKGGDGVVRWRREKGIDHGGPAGGNGGDGGDVYMRAVRDLALLAKYTGAKEFRAEDGHSGERGSRYGRDGEEIYIDVPVGAKVIDVDRDRTYHFETEGEVHKILKGGRGGLGNEYFKSAINQTPQESTKGKTGERGTFQIELSLVVDVGFVGFPNAGKSTLLNALTHAHARVGAYPFTTLEPHLGDLYGFTLADIPGLIKGASQGKGLGHKFLKHIERTKMLIHCISLELEDVHVAYKTIRNELANFNPELLKKEEWVVLTKSDIVEADTLSKCQKLLTAETPHVYVVSAETDDGIKILSDALVKHLRSKG